MRPKQGTFAELNFERYRKPTRREKFLARMDRVVPWGKLTALIEPVYPTGEGAGRPPIGLERMLRIHFLQHWFNLSDPAEKLFRKSNPSTMFRDLLLPFLAAPRVDRATKTLCSVWLLGLMLDVAGQTQNRA